MTRKDKRESIIDAFRDAWDLIPDVSFGQLVMYIMEQEDPMEVGDEELMTYANDFIRNNM